MSPVQVAIDMAKTLVAQIKAATAAKAAGAAAAAAARYKVAETHDDLRQAVVAAFNRDKTDMINKVGVMQITPALSTFFNAAMAAGEAMNLVNLARLADQQKKLALAQQKANTAVPGLETGGTDWNAAKRALDTLPGVIQKLEEVPGWGGSASAQYGAMTQGQGSAADQLRVSVTAMPPAISSVKNMNHRIMQVVLMAIVQKIKAVENTDPGFPGTFAATRAAMGHLDQLSKTMDTELGLSTSQAAIDKLQGSVNDALAQVPDWPHA